MNTAHDNSVYLGLGSNMGDRSRHLRAGLAGLSAGGLRLRAVSSLYVTEPDLRPTSSGKKAEKVAAGGVPAAGESTAARGLEARATEHPRYLNCVAAFEADLQPRALLDLCLAVEKRQGRRCASVDHGAPQPRTLDIDILMIGQRVVDEPGLKVPHPLMMQRRFVLQPLAEIAPDLRHPTARSTIGEALALLPEGNGVELLEPPPDEVI